eukprot:160823-Prorocentrum_minimum.AAC.1
MAACSPTCAASYSWCARRMAASLRSRLLASASDCARARPASQSWTWRSAPACLSTIRWHAAKQLREQQTDRRTRACDQKSDRKSDPVKGSIRPAKVSIHAPVEGPILTLWRGRFTLQRSRFTLQRGRFTLQRSRFARVTKSEQT